MDNKVIALLAVALLVLVGSAISEYYALNSNLSLLSGGLLVTIFAANFLLPGNRYYTPLFVFSLMYLGYVVGGFYFAFSNEYFGKFLGFTSYSKEEVLEGMCVGLIYAEICYLALVMGVALFWSDKGFVLQDAHGFWVFFSKVYPVFVLPLILFGFLYWIWLSLSIFGGFLNSILYFQLFPHFVSDAGLSIIPYMFYYAGIYIWLIGIISKRERVSWLFILMSLIGFIMNLSTGRITLAVTFLMAQFLLYVYCFPRFSRKALIMLFSLIAIAFLVYFLRVASNYYYLGMDLADAYHGFFEKIIGGGNVADLQQLVIIFESFSAGDLMYGVTFFDWMRNTFGGLIGLPPSSVGLTIKELYLPESSGAPTPGAIGEMYVNFSYMAPLFMVVVGGGLAIVHRVAMRTSSILVLFVYCVFLSRFVFIYPKVDSTMFANFFWGCMPTLIVFGFIYFLYLVIYRNRYSIRVIK